MGKEFWGTFAVNDHCAAKAFVTDVMLYDRLVIPVPPDQPEEARWEKAGWDPKTLYKLLDILGDRVVKVPWDGYRQEAWKKRFDAAMGVGQETGPGAFQATRSVLTQGLPPQVMAVEAVSSYQSIDELEGALGMKPAGGGNIVLPAGAVTAILAHEFLVPDDPGWSHEDLLRAAVDFSSDRGFRRRRANLWRWQWDFVDAKMVVTDRSAIESAVEEMEELLAEERHATEKSKLLTATRYAFLVGAVTVAIMTAAMVPVALPPIAAAGAGVFMSVGQFTAENLLAPGPDSQERRAASFLADVQRHFGWKG
jgi:hypothetical protein